METLNTLPTRFIPNRVGWVNLVAYQSIKEMDDVLKRSVDPQMFNSFFKLMMDAMSVQEDSHENEIRIQ